MPGARAPIAGGRGQPGRGGGRGPAEHKPAVPPPLPVPTEDFDFDAMFKKFNKDDLKTVRCSGNRRGCGP